MEQVLLNNNASSKEQDVKSQDLPVNQKMFDVFREEIKTEMNALSLRMDSFDLKLEHVLKQMDINTEKIISQLSAHIHHQTLLIEEQNNRNKFVLDKYIFVSDKQEKLEQRVSKLEESEFGISAK